MNNVMIDLETLGTSTDSIILSIGAVKFDLESGKIADDGFYTSLSIESNLEHGRTLSEATLTWWMKQPKEAQVVFHDEEKMHLQAALEQFTDWLGHMKWRVWGKGPTFDLAKMAHAYEKFGWPVPWEFWNERCVRTYLDLPGAKHVAKVEPQVAHHALHDAVAQAQQVIDVHAALFGRKVRA